ncbi:MAG: hypothetical protein VX670_11045, partial [Candidatus Latescibacterota bacterium]|nr:hypothetical protein [Candidatus Latescibacterota bacterium]
MLKDESRQQRAREWAARGAELRRMKGGVSPRVVSRCGPELLGMMQALPLYALPSPSHGSLLQA